MLFIETAGVMSSYVLALCNVFVLGAVCPRPFITLNAIQVCCYTVYLKTRQTANLKIISRSLQCQLGVWCERPTRNWTFCYTAKHKFASIALHSTCNIERATTQIHMCCWARQNPCRGTFCVKQNRLLDTRLQNKQSILNEPCTTNHIFRKDS